MQFCLNTNFKLIYISVQFCIRFGFQNTMNVIPILSLFVVMIICAMLTFVHSMAIASTSNTTTSWSALPNNSIQNSHSTKSGHNFIEFKWKEEPNQLAPELLLPIAVILFLVALILLAIVTYLFCEEHQWFEWHRPSPPRKAIFDEVRPLKAYETIFE